MKKAHSFPQICFVSALMLTLSGYTFTLRQTGLEESKPTQKALTAALVSAARVAGLEEKWEPVGWFQGKISGIFYDVSDRAIVTGFRSPSEYDTKTLGVHPRYVAAGFGLGKPPGTRGDRSDVEFPIPVPAAPSTVTGTVHATGLNLVFISRLHQSRLRVYAANVSASNEGMVKRGEIRLIRLAISDLNRPVSLAYEDDSSTLYIAEKRHLSPSRPIRVRAFKVEGSFDRGQAFHLKPTEFSVSLAHQPEAMICDRGRLYILLPGLQSTGGHYQLRIYDSQTGQELGSENLDSTEGRTSRSIPSLLVRQIRGKPHLLWMEKFREGEGSPRHAIAAYDLEQHSLVGLTTLNPHQEWSDHLGYDSRRNRILLARQKRGADNTVTSEIMTAPLSYVIKPTTAPERTLSGLEEKATRFQTSQVQGRLQAVLRNLTLGGFTYQVLDQGLLGRYRYAAVLSELHPGVWIDRSEDLAETERLVADLKSRGVSWVDHYGQSERADRFRAAANREYIHVRAAPATELEQLRQFLANLVGLNNPDLLEPRLERMGLTLQQIASWLDQLA